MDELIQRSANEKYNKFTLHMFNLCADELEYRIDFDDFEGDSGVCCTLCMISPWDKDVNSDAYKLAVAIENTFNLPHNAEELHDPYKEITESNESKKYYRVEIEDAFGDRAGLWTAAFDLIPTKETIESNPEDFEELTTEERYRFYRFNDLLRQLSRIKSPAVSSTCVFAFTENKYKQIKHILEEMNKLLKEMGFKLIVNTLDINDNRIKYRDDDQIAYSKNK